VGLVRTAFSLALVLITLGLAPTVARAAPADAGAADGARLAEMSRSLDEEIAQLSTSDCELACQALASIRRAAEGICALDQGVRCASARERAAAATRRVREACPGCAAARATEPGRREDAYAGNDVAVAKATSEVPPESRRGGCAGCTASGSDRGGGGGAAALAAASLALALAARGRRRRAR